MVHALWISAFAVLTSLSSFVTEDNFHKRQPVTLLPDSETTFSPENISTSSTTEEYQSEDILHTTSSNNIEIDDSSSNDLKEYIKEVLEAHNRYRTFHGVPTLQLNEDLTKKSQSWANHLAEVNVIENSVSEFAENIYVETIYAKRNGSSAVKYWYDKIQYYVPGNLTSDWWNAASFTQLIWAKSKYLGIGMAENDQFRFVVCLYDPPGNIIGQDPLEIDDYPELPLQKTFYILPGGIYREANENENLTSSILEKFVKQILEAHNYFRTLHGVPPLQLDKQLNKESQTWADELANTSTFHHSSSLHGENIYKEPIFFDRNGTTPVKFWYDEIEFYTFGKEPEDWYKVGHFTQLIWASTKYIGVGISENEDTRFIVCNYDPRGNIIKQTHYERLVPPLVTNNSTLKVTNNFSNDLVSTNNKSNFNSVVEDFLEMFNDFIRSKYGYTKNETIINAASNNNTTENNTKLINFQAAINNSTIKTAILDRISVILNEISAD